MPVRIITVEREYGSGGVFIAEKLAARLSWVFWDQGLTAEIAKIAKVHPAAAERCDERRDPLLYRLAKVFARGSYERSLPLEGHEVFDAGRMVELVTQVIEGAASSGHCVIVGRGAPYILRNRPDAFHVFVYAPYEEKLRRLLALGKSKDEAKEMLESIDRERAAFIKQYFGADWPVRYLYNLWINSVIGDDAVVETILSAIEVFDKTSAKAEAKP
jgi:cytidylate kinase